MKQLKYFSLLLLLAWAGITGLHAQVVVGNSADYDIDYLTPKTYEIGGITLENADNLDHRMVLLVAGLQVGEVIKLPGDKISQAIDNLWEQGLFEDVQIRVTRIQDDKVFLKIVLQGRPKLAAFSLKGVSKNDASKLREKLSLRAGEVVTENMVTTSVNKIRAHYADKGYTSAAVETKTEPDTAGGDHVLLHFIIKPGKRVKIDSLIIEGNSEDRHVVPLAKNVPILKNINVNKKSPTRTNKLIRKMKGTHDVHYAKKLYMWTAGFWKRSKYQEATLREDLDAIVEYYNELGYRDARIVFDTVCEVDVDSLDISDRKKSREDRIKVKVRIHEGRPFYFRNITFSGNTVYDSETLAKHLRINKGDPYNETTLQTNLTYNPSGTDVSSLYMDNGYLFFSATPVEVAVVNDSIDIEVRIVEGKQARIRNVTIEGNTVTNDKILMRELHTRPGDLFSRDAVLRSRRELVTLGYFDEQKLIPEPRPNAKDGTVDIVYKVEEKTTSQLNLQGGYGSGMFVGQVGVQLTNFSARNIFNKKAWQPLPAGDGQKLGINFTTNGTYYYAVNLSFSEPWLGKKRPQSFSVNVYKNYQSNGFWVENNASSSFNSIGITGVSLSLTRRLKWPDDYFILSQAANFKRYDCNNWTYIPAFSNGVSNEFSYSLGFSRNSFDAPIFPRSGSEVSVNGTVTPPYSLFNNKDYVNATPQEHYKWLEYFKVNVRGSWMLNLVGDVVLNARFRFGYMGYYNQDVGLSPFGRYYVGGDGLNSYHYDGREIIPLRGYVANTLSPTDGASVFDRYVLELRQPVIESPNATIFVLGFLEGGNSWSSIKQFQPFKVYNSAGVGIRLYFPMLGFFGFDWGYGFDGAYGGSQFHFTIGQSID